MKTINLSTLLMLFVLFSCYAGGTSGDPSLRFGIHETVRISELPACVMDTLKTTVFRPEHDQQSSILGYLAKNDPLPFDGLNFMEGILFLKALFPVDEEGQYQAIVVVKQEPALNLSDVRETKSRGQNVEIYFTLEGARKWAAMTEGNMGRNVAFVIDDHVYSMPLINGMIKSGVAVISGLPDELTARELSERMNEGL